MMAAAAAALIGRLPPVRGRLRAQAPLDRVSWFRVGGPAEVLFTPADVDDLCGFLARRPKGVPVTVLGVCSNVLIRDGGIDGVVIRLGRAFAGIEPQGERVRAGGAALDLNVARVACEAGLGGLEFLSGVPGTIGGAIRMNAGAYGREIGEVAEAVEAVDETGSLHRLTGPEVGFSYRRSGLPEGWLCTAAMLRGRTGERAAIAARMAEIAAEREASQPIRTRTGGSTFANPPAEAAAGAKAWQLIERAGCRGLGVGGARVSEKHCNFLINTGTATAADIETLGEEVRRRVLEATGVRLEWEIRRLGRHAGGPREARA
jgi:UDP-N-acetylmuramate dehydrogenase